MKSSIPGMQRTIPAAPRRLLLVSQPLSAGVPHHVLDLLAGLDPGAFHFDVACPRRSTLWARLADDPRVTLHPIAGQRAPSPIDLYTLLRLIPLVRRADIVHCHSSKAGFLARLAARLTGRSDICVFSPHGWSFWSADGVAARLYSMIERRAARWCRFIISVSEHERDAGLAAGIGRAESYRVVFNGIDLEGFGAPWEPVPGRVVMVGRLAAPKRPDLAIRAFAMVRERIPRAEFHLAGEGPQRVSLERLASDLGVSDAVRFLGTRDDIPEILARAHCFLLASDYEGCPLTVLEAMAAGVPVVATGVGGVSEIVTDKNAGLLVPPGDPDLLSDALEVVLSDQHRARAIGAEGRRVARLRYARERMAKEIACVYEEVAP